MDALLRSRRLLVREFGESLRRQVARQVVLLLLVLLLGVALTLGVRRLTDALERPLAASNLLAAGAALAATATLLRYAAQQLFSRRASQSIHAFVTLSLLVIGVSLSLPASPSSGLLTLWLLLIAAESLAWATCRTAHIPPRRVPPDSQRIVGSKPLDCVAPPIDEPSDVHAVEPGLLQQITRARTAAGIETVSGWLGVELSAGQRSATAHVAFCPPFARVPKIEVFTEEDEARIKLAQVLPHGARFEVKLIAPAEEPHVLPLRFSATCGE